MGRRLQRIGPLVVGMVLLVVSLGGCGSKKKHGIAEEAFQDAETLYEEATGHLADRDLHKAREKLEWVGFTAENRVTLEPLVKLALADIAFYQGNELSLIDARAQYLDFVTLYSDHPRAPYAQLQAGVCSLLQANNPSRDQTETLQAIEDLKEVVRRWPDSYYAKVAQDKISEAGTTLAEHEFLVGRFYLKRDAYEAATSRFKLVLEKYPRYPEKEKLYYHLGRALILSGDEIEGRLYLDKLVRDYPNGEWTEEAQKLLLASEGEERDGTAGAGR